MHKLKLEVFESTSSIEPISFYVYKIVPKEQPLSIQQFMRSVAGKTRNCQMLWMKNPEICLGCNL